MTSSNRLWELKNPESGSLDFRVGQFENDSLFSGMSGFNYFSVILFPEGCGELEADLHTFTFNAGTLICVSPYQPVKITCKDPCAGYVVNFHADFFCLHQHRNEVSCNGILFNNIYEPPLLALSAAETGPLARVIAGMITEMERPGAAEFDILLSYLKILLIDASRLKAAKRQPALLPGGREPKIVNELREAIEKNFRELHRPGEYAALLNRSAPVLNRTAKTHFNKTLSQLVADRIVVEAKRQLYLTAKPVKLIAFELGFNDEFYFSRYFKSKMSVSPQRFRATVGVDRAQG